MKYKTDVQLMWNLILVISTKSENSKDDGWKCESYTVFHYSLGEFSIVFYFVLLAVVDREYYVILTMVATIRFYMKQV